MYEVKFNKNSGYIIFDDDFKEKLSLGKSSMSDPKVVGIAINEENFDSYLYVADSGKIASGVRSRFLVFSGNSGRVKNSGFITTINTLFVPTSDNYILKVDKKPITVEGNRVLYKMSHVIDSKAEALEVRDDVEEELGEETAEELIVDLEELPDLPEGMDEDFQERLLEIYNRTRARGQIRGGTPIGEVFGTDGPF